MSLGDVYRASAIFEVPGADGKMVFTSHFRTEVVNTVLTDFQEAADIAIEAASTIETFYMPFVSDQFIFEEVKVIGISNPLVGVSQVSNTAGSDTDDYVALRSAPVARLKTGIRGRSYNGRMFLLPCGEAQQNGGTMISSYVTSLTTFIAAYRRLSQQPSTNVYDMVIYSKKLSDASMTVVSNLVANWLVNDTMGSLRGRQTV